MAHLKDLIVNGASRFIGKAYGAFVGSFSGNLDGNATTSTTANTARACSGNAATASKLSTARKINITGNATGAAAFDGSGDISINTTVSQAAHADKATQDTNGRAFTDTNAYMHISALADNTDFNNVKTTGIYYCTGNTYSNRPHNSWGILTVYSIGTVKQEYRPDNVAVYYTREYNNANWTEWSKVAASTADSATNADTVDGIHAASLFYDKGAWDADNWATTGTYEVKENRPTTVGYNYGQVISSSSGGSRFQLYAAHLFNYDGRLHYRTGWDDDKQLWNTILDSENYNLFAPTKTGVGASGTWGINISGNAATATTATTATKANGLTGSLNFPDIGDVATSNKISWNGSTDGADIYYQTTASDQGNLVLNLRDDANCYLRIAYNGAFKSYFTPADGNFHGNVNGKSDSAGSADTSAAINYSNIGTNYIKAGSNDTGDAANQTANMVIGSWNGITFYDVCGNKIAGGMNVRDGSLTMKGTITGSKVYNAVYNDYAEFFEKDEDTAFEAGDIVALDTNSEEERYIKATEDSIVVVGVCTHEYAHIIGGKGQTIEENEKEFVPISLMGRVHVKVDDTVKRGDKVTASKVPGIGRKAMPGEHSIGTALTNPSNGKVRVLINL